MTSSGTVLVTGANGFIGRHLVSALLDSGYQVKGTVRNEMGDVATNPNYEQVVVGDIGPDTRWDAALEGVDAVVHLAARVHIMHEDSANPEEIYHRINLQGSVALAEACVRLGVQRYIYTSTVKVHGAERSVPYTENDPPSPEDSYGRSKAEAEAALQAMEGLKCAALRPPLVYGPGVKGNFQSLLSLVSHGFPLPFSSIDNQRSMIHVMNFVDAVLFILASPVPLEGPFLLRDGDDISTPELVRYLAKGMDKSIRLLPVPPSLLRAAGKLAGKQGLVRRLVDSLRVDDAKLRSTGWEPPISAGRGIAETARWYLHNRENR